MTPKQKAKQIVNKYTYGHCKNDYYLCQTRDGVIKCALISVDEIIKSSQLNYLFTQEEISCMESTSDDRWIRDRFLKYWKEVKKEIKKL